MRIVDVRETAVALKSELRNAVFDFSEMTTSVVAVITDVVREGSEVFASGKTRVAERALGVDLSGGPVWMDGVLSRKKQIAARLLEAMGA